MSDPKPDDAPPSLADYFVRYDLAAMIREARQDYNESISGAPRLLDQTDIAARFRRTSKPADGQAS